MSATQVLVLPELYAAIRSVTSIDEVDWHVATQFAERWKLSIADALLDLHFVDEDILAQALAQANQCSYLAANQLEPDFSEVDLDSFDDLVSVGALPLKGARLAVCNPYDDLRGNLGNRMCEREIVVSERTGIYDILRRQSLEDWQTEGAGDAEWAEPDKA